MLLLLLVVIATVCLFLLITLALAVVLLLLQFPRILCLPFFLRRVGVVALPETGNPPPVVDADIPGVTTITGTTAIIIAIAATAAAIVDGFESLSRLLVLCQLASELLLLLVPSLGTRIARRLFSQALESVVAVRVERTGAGWAAVVVVAGLVVVVVVTAVVIALLLQARMRLLVFQQLLCEFRLFFSL